MVSIYALGTPPLKLFVICFFYLFVYIIRRWDTHGHPLADFSGNDPESELFPGIYNDTVFFILFVLIIPCDI